VTVPHDQLSLAIGKKGQNARLASRLLGWNIDIRSDLELRGEVPEKPEEEGQSGITVTPDGTEVPMDFSNQAEESDKVES
jgi:transcription antitermination factor NusA-like protein